MPVIFFIEIGLAAGSYGLTEIVWAKRNQRMAEKINMRARELLSGTIAEGVEAKPSQELEPIMPATEKWTSAAKMGLLAAAGVYGLAGLLALTGRTLARSRPRGMEVIGKYTILSILGNGSPAVLAVVLAGIAVGTVVAIISRLARKKAQENLERAWSTLFLAKRSRREKIEDGKETLWKII